MSTVVHLSDALHRLTRMQQFADHDARLRPTPDELAARRKRIGVELSRDASLVKRTPRLLNPDDVPPRAA